MTHLQLQLFGSFEAAWGEQPLEFHSDRVRVLLAYLVAESNRQHSREALAALLWERHGTSAGLTNLRNVLAQLKRTLSPLKALADSGSFVLVVRRTSAGLGVRPHDQLSIDVTEFDQLMRHCLAHRHRAIERCHLCLARMARMVALYQGDFLAGLYAQHAPLLEQWITSQRERRYGELIGALQLLTSYAAAIGDIAQLQLYAQRLLLLEPWREGVHRQVMEALGRNGARHAALIQYDACIRALKHELNAAPAPETQQLAEALRSGTLPGRPAGPLAHVPPGGGTLVGYEHELADVIAHLWDPECQLLTLLGPAGVGKTRLSIEIAHIVARWADVTDGVYFVALSASEAPADVYAAIGASLGIEAHTPSALATALHDRQLLLIIDQAEHLLAHGAAFPLLLQNLLALAPTVKCLVTSRVPLQLRSEWRKRLGGLAYAADPELPEHDTSAAMLFMQLARRIDPQLAFSAADLAAIRRICAAVQGLPLAIEIAAALLDRHTCAEIAQHLQRSLDVLVHPMHDVTPQHRSLRAAWEASWQMLVPAEREALLQLVVQEHPFTLADAQATLSTWPPAAVRSIITALVDTSWLDLTGELYRWHDVVRYVIHKKRAEQLDC